MNRDGVRKSVWQEEIGQFPSSININDVFDIAIIGGGITGVSTAYKLQKAGKKCILIEAFNIGFGTTGGTTAHLNNFYDTSYAEAISKFGLANANLLAESAIEAMEIIVSNINDNEIKCDFESKSAHLFALDEKQKKQLEEMMEGSEKVGHKMIPIQETAFPIPFTKAVEIPGQGQFHPIKYIRRLSQVFLNSGGAIAEHCRCESHSEEEHFIVLNTSKGVIKAKSVVYATHIPPGISRLHFTNSPYRSYAIACTLQEDSYPEQLGYDLTDPYHYYRVHEVNGEKLLIAGGEDHKTGHSEDTGECFSQLENYVRSHFAVDLVKYSWSSQYYEPVDGLPYIGKLPGAKNIYTATGFRGNGMMFGSLSSKIISDLILTGNSKYERFFDPSRVDPVAGLTEFVKENITVMTDFVKDKLFMDKITSIAEIKNGEGRVVKYEGESYALYKEAEGKIHLLKSTCPHARCEVHWNGAELSWDCPCHGSRFGINGEVLTAPSVKGLVKVQEKSL